MAAYGIAVGFEAPSGAFLAGEAVAHLLDKQPRAALGIGHIERDAVETCQRMLRRDGTVGPEPRRFSVLVDNQLQHHAVRVAEREARRRQSRVCSSPTLTPCSARRFCQ